MKSIKVEYVVFAVLVMGILLGTVGVITYLNSTEADKQFDMIIKKVFSSIESKRGKEVPSENLTYDKDILEGETPAETLNYDPKDLTSGDVVETQRVNTTESQVVLGELLENPLFKGAIDLVLIMMAGFAWFTYFAGFDPAKAIAKVIHPVMLTFMAFQWQELIKWVGIV